MIKFTYEAKGYYYEELGVDGNQPYDTDITITISDDADVYGVMNAFIAFMKGTGYNADTIREGLNYLGEIATNEFPEAKGN